MSEYRDLEDRLARQIPSVPRSDLRDELLGRVHDRLRAVPLARFAVAAGLLIAALLASRFEEFGHRRRVEAILARGSNPRIERVMRELSPYPASEQLQARLRLETRRKSDQRWARYMMARFRAGEDHG